MRTLIGNRGFSLLEVTVAVGLSMASITVALRANRFFQNRMQSILVKQAHHELDDEVRGALAREIEAYVLKSAQATPKCDATVRSVPFAGLLAGDALPSGRRLRLLDETYHRRFINTVNTAKLSPQFRATLLRCQTANTLYPTQGGRLLSRYDAKIGFPFCFHVVREASHTKPGSIESMQPVVIEAMYTRLNLLPQRQVTCGETAAPTQSDNTVGVLHYTIHWASEISGETINRSHSGLQVTAE